MNENDYLNKCVFVFDLSGVVCKSNKKKLEEFAKKSKIGKKKLVELLDGKMSILHRKGKITSNQFWKYIELNLPQSNMIFDLHHAWHSNYQLDNFLMDTIQFLRQTGFKVGIASGASKERIEYLQKFQIIDFSNSFDFQFHSYKIGYGKIEFEYWNLLEKQIYNSYKVTRKNIIVIDDDQKHINLLNNRGFLAVKY